MVYNGDYPICTCNVLNTFNRDSYSLFIRTSKLLFFFVSAAPNRKPRNNLAPRDRWSSVTQSLGTRERMDKMEEELFVKKYSSGFVVYISRASCGLSSHFVGSYDNWYIKASQDKASLHASPLNLAVGKRDEEKEAKRKNDGEGGRGGKSGKSCYSHCTTGSPLPSCFFFSIRTVTYVSKVSQSQLTVIQLAQLSS